MRKKTKTQIYIHYEKDIYIILTQAYKYNKFKIMIMNLHFFVLICGIIVKFGQIEKIFPNYNAIFYIN